MTENTNAIWDLSFLLTEQNRIYDKRFKEFSSFVWLRPKITCKYSNLR